MTAPDVAVVVPALAGGGAQRAAVTIVDHLGRRGLDVELVCLRAEGPLLEHVPPSCSLVDLRVARARYALPRLVSYLRRQRPTAMLACMDRTIVLAVIAAALARVGTRVVGQVQNTMSVATAGGRWQERIQPVLARIFYPRCSAVVAVSEGVAHDLIDIGVPARVVEVIYNPVPVDEVAAAAARPPPHPWFGTDRMGRLPGGSGGPPVILGIGRLTKQKDFPTLIRAFSRVRERTEARLVILGEGEDRAMLERLSRDEGVDDDVDLPGFVDDPASYLGAASVFVLSSAWEGFGLVIVEALAAGTPVVATDCRSGPSEILDDGRFGSLVPVGNVDAMAEAILAALSTPRDRDALRTRAERFAPAHILPRYEQVLGVVDHR